MESCQPIKRLKVKKKKKKKRKKKKKKKKKTQTNVIHTNSKERLWSRFTTIEIHFRRCRGR